MDPDEEKRIRDEQLWGNRSWERQEQMKCGRHAINTLIGGPQLVDPDFEAATDAVCAETGDDRRLHIAPRGWYSKEVLARLLDMTSPPRGRLILKPCNETTCHNILQDEQVYGCLISQKSTHWVCVVKQNGVVLYADDCRTPVAINLQDYRAIVQHYPMTCLLEKQFEP